MGTTAGHTPPKSPLETPPSGAIPSIAPPSTGHRLAEPGRSPIASLPPELLDNVLMLLATSGEQGSLLSAALVARNWTAGARRALHLHITLSSDRAAFLWSLGSHVTTYALFTRTLEMKGVQAATAARCLTLCGGLKQLTLKTCGELDYEVLSLPSLSGLTSLVLDSEIARPSVATPRPSVPALTSLEIRHNAHATIGLLRPLFTAIASSLTELKLTMWHIGTTYAWEKVLPLIKQNLTHLTVACRLTNEVVAVLTDFHRLTHFGFERRNINNDLQRLQQIITGFDRTRLYHLDIIGSVEDGVSSYSYAANALSHPPFDRITSIRICEGHYPPTTPPRRFPARYELMALLHACARRGVKLEVPAPYAEHMRSERMRLTSEDQDFDLIISVPRHGDRLSPMQ